MFFPGIAPIVVPDPGVLTPEPTRVASVESPSNCPTAATGVTLVDKAYSFQVVMPSNWRNLPAGDPGWVTVFGSHGSATEKLIKDGITQDFAIPLTPRDDDTQVNLATYVRSTTPGDTLDDLADGYATVLEDAGDLAITIDLVALPSGEAAKLTAVRLADSEHFDRSTIVAYILQNSGYAYTLVFASSQVTETHYAQVFSCMASSFEVNAPLPKA